MIQLTIIVTFTIAIIVMAIGRKMDKKTEADPPVALSVSLGNKIIGVFLLNLVIATAYCSMAYEPLLGSGSADDIKVVIAGFFALAYGVIAIRLASKRFAAGDKGTGYAYLSFGVLILMPAVLGMLLLLWASGIDHFQ